VDGLERKSVRIRAATVSVILADYLHHNANTLNENGILSLAQSIARKMPRGLRQYGRDWFETRFRGTPQGFLKYRASELRINLDFVLSHYRLTHPEIPCIRYVEVGANDGIAGDPIFPWIGKHHLRGVLIEPQKDAFTRLERNYSHLDGFRLVHAAIAENDGEKTLYRIKPEAQGPEWLHHVASFDRKLLESHAHRIPNLLSMIVTEQVPCISVGSLFRKFEIERFDMLQIDAEGFDAKILKFFDIPSRTPPIVRFEHSHLDATDHEDSVRMLVECGYQIAMQGSDTLAYRDDKRTS
jgi:FkbM family methyltransferase